MPENVYESIGRVFGRERIDKLGKFLSQGGISISPLQAAGFGLFSSILLSIGLFVLFSIKSPLRNLLYKFLLLFLQPYVFFDLMFVNISSVILSFILGFGLVIGIGYVLVKFSIDERRNKIEEALPDFLVLAAANARAGMTIDQALWNAAKPEFGLLSKEIQIVAKKSFGGEPIDEALDHLNRVVDSKIIKRTVSLIKQGLAAGSEIALILEKTAEDTRQMQIIQKDLRSSLLMYVIFIGFAAAFGTPFLYSVSEKLIQLMESIFKGIQPATSSAFSFGANFIKPQAPFITSNQFSIFVLLMMLGTSFTASILIGLIQKGKKLEGFKYFPLIFISALILYFLLSSFLDMFVSQL